MAFVLADRVKESTVSPGTGTATLGGAASGYQSFSAGIGASNTTYYVIADQSGANWEVGYGTIGAGGTTLARTTVLASSNSGSLVNFSSGTQDVWCDYPAKKAVIQDSSTNVTVPAQLTAGNYVANASTSGSSSTGAFAYGTLSYSDINHILTMAASQNNYIQMEIQNTNTGAAASSDVIVGNNNTTASTYYGDFGMNSGGWAGTGAFTAPNNVYLTATSGDLAIGTTTSNQIRFAVNGGTTDALTIATTGAVTTPNQLTGATVRASNGIVVNSKTVSASYTIASGDNAMSAGPVTVASGQSVTVSSGSRWVVL
jgi:hypothetical protein